MGNFIASKRLYMSIISCQCSKLKEIIEVLTEKDLDENGPEILNQLTRDEGSIITEAPELFLAMVKRAPWLIGSPCFTESIQVRDKNMKLSTHHF